MRLMLMVAVGCFLRLGLAEGLGVVELGFVLARNRAFAGVAVPGRFEDMQRASRREILECRFILANVTTFGGALISISGT